MIKFLVAYTLSLAPHVCHVEMRGFSPDSVDLVMPAWTPGYYQIMDYASRVSNFSAVDDHGRTLPWGHVASAVWRVHVHGAFQVHYDVKAEKRFVAESFVDSAHAYIVPGSVFLYPAGGLNQPADVSIALPAGWRSVATGLDPGAAGTGPGAPGTYRAHNFDELYDAPILAGNLESLPAFYVQGIPHYFTGLDLGTFERAQFTGDLKKIVETCARLMGDIPYKHYTFLATGDGRGGIEHANSCSLSFNGSELNTPDGRRRMLSFIAHEYFHLYNVKRIRPIELGPFDYQHEDRTHLLWVSEGFTVYYEYLLLLRAGLTGTEDVFKNLAGNIAAYENTPGHLYQSLTQASWETWSDGPFGGSLDSTISYYDKGPVVALFMDFAIRHATGNKRSLDDVMRLLYRHYYKELGRGFTDSEFRSACENMAGVPLDEVFDYATTVKPLTYDKYLAYAGLRLVKEGTSFRIERQAQPDSLQEAILRAWSHQ